MEKIIHDVENDTINKVKLSREEIDLLEKQAKEIETRSLADIEKNNEKIAARASALAKLAALGLTEDEIAAL